MWTAVGAFSDPAPVEGETKAGEENSKWHASQKSKSAHTEHFHRAPTIGHIWHPSQTALLRKRRISHQSSVTQITHAQKSRLNSNVSPPHA